MNEDTSRIEHDMLEHAGHLRQLALRLVADEERADEVVQRTWLAALRSRPHGGRGLRAWLSQVARRCAWALNREELRRAAKESESTRRQHGPANPPEAGDEFARSEVVRQLLQALGELEEPFGSAVLMRYFEGLEPIEIAHRIGVPVATVRTRIHRGLQEIRALMKQKGAENDWTLALLPLLLVPLTTITAAAKATGVGSLIQGILLMNKKTGIALGIVALVVAGIFTIQILDTDSETQIQETKNYGSADAQEARRNQELSIDERNALATKKSDDSKTQSPRRETNKPSWDLKGRIVDNSQQGLANAEVSIELFREGGTKRRNVRSDETGSFHFVGLPLGEGLLLRAGHHGHAPAYVSVAAGREGIRALGDIVLPVASGLQGQVVDEKGRPVVDATVRPRPRNHATYTRRRDTLGSLRDDRAYLEMGSVQTDQEGCFALVNLPAGEWTLAASTPHRPTSFLRGQNLQEGETKTDLKIVLRIGVSIKGRLVDRSKAPIANGEILARPAFLDREGSVRKTVHSDANGFFVLEGLEEIPYTLGVSAVGFIGSSLFDVDGGREDLKISLEPSAQLFGRVLDRQTNEPIEEIKVRVLGGLDFGSAMERSIQVVTGEAAAKALNLDDATGLWFAPDIPRQRCEVRVQAPGYAVFSAQGISLTSGVPLEFNCELAPEATLTGRVTNPDGLGISKATVWATLAPPNEEQSGPNGARIKIRSVVRSAGGSSGEAFEQATGSATSDEDGRYEIRGLGPGHWTILAERPGWAPSEERKTQLGAGQEQSLNLVLRAGGTIRGLVLDAEGLPRAGAQVTIKYTTDEFQRSDFRPAPSTVSDEEGRFEFQSVEVGKWTASLQKPTTRDRGMTFEIEGKNPVSGVLVNVREGEVSDIRIEIPPPTSISGLVLETGRPAPGVRVKLVPTSDSPLLGAPEVTTDTWGEFLFNDIKPGSYQLELRMPRSSAPARTQVDVALGEAAQVRIKLPTSQVTGRISAADDGKNLENMLVSLNRLIDGKPEPRKGAIMISMTVSSENGAEASMARLGDDLGRIRTAADGTYVISHVPAGEYLIRVQGQGMLRESRAIKVKQEKRLTNQDFTMSQGRTLDIHLTGLGRQAIALLTLKSLDDPNAETERKTSNGKPIVFRGLRPGRYEIEFRRITIGEADVENAPEQFTRKVTIPEDRDQKLIINTLQP